MIIVGWGKNSKKIADAGLMRCKNCNNIAFYELRELCNKISVYFIPVAKWKKKYYLVCPVCDAGFEIEESFKNDILVDCLRLPTKKISLEIWDFIIKSFEEFKGESDDVQNLIIDVGSKLARKGYKKDDISYVMDTFINDLIKVFGKS